jgi:tetratricopeptide (TPR) repeat protein
MKNRVGKQLNEAVNLLQKGNQLGAIELLRAALRKESKNFDALHILGIVLAGNGDLHSAVALLRKAVIVQPTNGVAHFNLAKAMSEAGNDIEALSHHKKSVGIDPGRHESWLNYGISLQKLQRHEESLNCFDRAIQINRSHPLAWSNRGIALEKLERFNEALESYRTALDIAPDFIYALYNMAGALRRTGQHINALKIYDEILASNPEHLDSWVNRGACLTEVKRHEDALLSYTKATQIKNDDAVAWLGHGVSLNFLGRYTEALSSFDKTISIDRGSCEAWTNRGNTLFNLKRSQEALECYLTALAIDPDFAEAHYNESICRLSNMDFQKGWQEFEWRWKKKNARPCRFSSHMPLWNGEHVDHLLLWCDQGIGDEVLWSSLWPNLEGIANKVTVEIDPRLLPLFSRSFPGVHFLPREINLDTLTFDAHCRVDSLGQFLLNDLECFKKRNYPYLKPDIEKTKRLEKTLRASPSKTLCGISWLSKNEKFGDSKSIQLEMLDPILRLPGIQFIDLQYGDTSEIRAELYRKTGIEVRKIEEIDNYKDIDGFASLVAACDLVITVSNTTAHVAGALGKPTLLLVPYATGKLFYWHSLNGQSLWYPSINVFEQSASGDWQPAIKNAADTVYLMTKIA